MQTHILWYVDDISFNIVTLSTLLSHWRSVSILFLQSLTTMAYQVLINALKAPAHLQYQLAFLSSVSVRAKDAVV